MQLEQQHLALILAIDMLAPLSGHLDTGKSTQPTTSPALAQMNERTEVHVQWFETAAAAVHG